MNRTSFVKQLSRCCKATLSTPPLPTHSEVVPSFVLLDVQEARLTIYVYELHKSSGPEPYELKVFSPIKS